MKTPTAATATFCGWRALETPGWFGLSCTDPECTHHLHHRTLLSVSRVRHDRKLLDPLQGESGQFQDRYASWRRARRGGVVGA